ncbi:MAG: hypothetical protein AABY34_01280 [Pseudomonadota bacterium]
MQTNKKHSGLLVLFLVLIAAIAATSVFVPGLLGATFGFLVAGTVIFCVAVLLLFILTGIGALILGIIFFVWTVIAIILFPIFFPILLPLFLVFVFFSLMRKKD